MKTVQILSVGLLLSLMACDPFTDQEHNVSPDSVTEITLRRSLKRIQRFSCEGTLLSDKVEEISRPNALIHIHPKVSKSRVYTSDFNNLTTGSTESATANLIGVYVDISPSSLALHVAEGSNVIQYKYTECLQKVYNEEIKADECKDERSLEEGQIRLDVKFVEETLPGLSEYRETCPVRQI